MRTALKRAEPCLNGRIQASPCMVLTETDQCEGIGRLAIVGREEAPGTKDPATQRIVLGFRRGLQCQLVP
jgi:hypothetical protein